MNSEPVGSNFPSSKNDILENVNSIISDGIEKVQCTLRQQNELYSRLNSDLKNTLLSNGSNIHSNSNPCSHVSEIINALNENFDNQNVHILDLPDHYKFNGDPARLVRFLQHITNKVLVRLHNPYVQWESITRNLVGSVRELAEKFYLHDMNIKEATFRFLNHLIDSYGNRFTIAYALISYFLDFKVEHSRNKIELLEYSAKLKIFICQMSYIGCSNFIDNPVFLNQALDNVPVFIRDRWSKFSVEKIFSLVKFFIVMRILICLTILPKISILSIKMILLMYPHLYHVRAKARSTKYPLPLQRMNVGLHQITSLFMVVVLEKLIASMKLEIFYNLKIIFLILRIMLKLLFLSELI